MERSKDVKTKKNKYTEPKEKRKVSVEMQMSSEEKRKASVEKQMSSEEKRKASVEKQMNSKKRRKVPDEKRVNPERNKKEFEFQKSDVPVFLNECRFGDEYFFYEGSCGTPKYENINDKWNEFVTWIEDIRERNMSVEGFEDGEADRVGHEVIKWAKRHDVYAVFLLTKLHWECFRNTYLLVDGCPEIVLEFMRGIMFEKMTEEEMWGNEEERKPKGKLIIFDEAFLPKEGTDIGDVEIEYRPIAYTPEEEQLEDKTCPMEMYPIEKGLFPRGPVFFET